MGRRKIGNRKNRKKKKKWKMIVLMKINKHKKCKISYQKIREIRTKKNKNCKVSNKRSSRYYKLQSMQLKEHPSLAWMIS